jgi:predicted ATP-dependent protease
MIHELSVPELRRTCDPNTLPDENTTEPNHVGSIIGQERAVRAMRFGLDIRSWGFNIYVAGMAGTGRTTAVERFVEEIAVTQPTPVDWCYVYNFEDSYRPCAVSLPAGKAREFQKDVMAFLKMAIRDIHIAFDGEDYAAHQESSLRSFHEQKAQIFEKVNEMAREKGFSLQATPMGILPMPTKNGVPLSDADFLKFSEDEREKLKETMREIREAVDAAMRQMHTLDNDAREAVEQLDQQVIHFVLDHSMADILEKYRELPDILAFLNSIQMNMLENAAQFKPEPEEQHSAVASQSPKRTPIDRYRVNVLVDRSKLQGAPVVVEMNPTYSNLFGRIEQEAYMGTLVTDFTLIRGGSLHRANGGYLVLPAEDVIRNPFSWESLKRCLRNRSIAIEEPFDQPVFTTKSLRPEPIPLDVKVILIGRADLYGLLLDYDDQFRELFKVKADFDSQMAHSQENIREYASFVHRLCENEHLIHLGSSGLARVVEHGSRLVDDQTRLSTRFGELADMLREASYYAGQEKSERINASHIEQAIEQRFYRSRLIQEHIQDLIARQVIKIDVSGRVTGQVNSLAVLQLGDISFSQPSRITASIGLGKSGVVNVEREAEMSRPVHTKGVLILSGYLEQVFARDKPLSLNARLVFEQNYGIVDGDSASSAELYAILSALAEIPIQQGIAVTGSVNQKGEIQAVGGVNEKIEGFYAVCKTRGLTGNQGVMIPSSNVSNLMLKQEIVDAVACGQFRVWSINSIEEGIEVLTEFPAGKKEDGSFASGSIFERVNLRLVKMAEELARFGGEKD